MRWDNEIVRPGVALLADVTGDLGEVGVMPVWLFCPFEQLAGRTGQFFSTVEGHHADFVLNPFQSCYISSIPMYIPVKAWVFEMSSCA
jgi:hypothetical protein